MSVPRGFISVGKNILLNINCINLDKSYIDPDSDKAVLFDKFDIKYVIDKKQIKGKVEIK